ncbi:MAG: lysophospholipid acyltransferase family protein [Candidatus Omnitrophica bacterium]|nr:lysophospholipid acyltransferase family protein [Candidatus Omnitrophota bacterium]
MDLKKIKKSVPRFFGWFGIIFCSLAIKFIPKRCIYGFASGLSSLAYRFAKKQKKIALESLKIAFGEDKPNQELEKIAEDSFNLMAKSAIELMFMMDKPELLRNSVGFENLKNLDQALSRGKGVILVSAHFGNFPLLLARLSQEGYDVSGIMRPMRDERVEKIFLDKRKKYNVKTIYSQPRNVCVDSTIRELRNNAIVFIPIDQNFGTAGVFVDFFGVKAATATGPVVFAQRTQAVLLPCFIVRKDDNKHKIIFDEPIELEEGKDSKETIAINIQRLTNVIELYIRKYPAEWGWIHRRWKSKPS